MAKFREKTPAFEACRFDGKLVGEWDATTGSVVPRTCPKWFPALAREIFAPVELGAVADGELVGMEDRLYLKRPELPILCIRPGDYIAWHMGMIQVSDPAAFEAAFEPA